MKKVILIGLLCLTEACNLSARDINLSLEKWGAKADGVVLSDGSISAGSNTLHSLAASFDGADINKIIFVAGALNDGNTLIGTITKVISKNSVTVSNPATATVVNAGITYGTDCTDAFIQFNKAARADENVVLNMKPGTYLTKFNNWLAGIKNVTINGNGCHIICTNGAYEPLSSPRVNVGLFMPSCFDNVDNNYYENKELGNVGYGYKINTASKGAEIVQTINSVDAGNFKKGNWVLIYGLHHEDFGGWPPDPTFFDYAKIKYIDGATGKIYLDRPLNYLYDAGWPDGKQKGGVGAARIINLDRDNFTTVENLVINDVSFTPFNGWNGKYANNQRNSRFELYGYIYAKITNVKASAAYFGQGKKLLVDQVTITGGCEPDKVLDSCIITNSNITQLINGVGLHYLYLKNNTFYGGFNASPRNLYVIGNTFKTNGTTSQSLASFGFNKGTDYIEVGTNTWDCSDGSKRFLLSPPLTITMKVSSVVDNTTVIIPYDSFIKDHDSRRIVPGSAGYTASGKKFEVKRVYQYDGDNIAVSGICTNGNPNAGDAYVFSMAPKISVTGKQIKTGANSNNYTLFQQLTPTIHLDLKDPSFKN